MDAVGWDPERCYFRSHRQKIAGVGFVSPTHPDKTSALTWIESLFKLSQVLRPVSANRPFVSGSFYDDRSAIIDG